VSIGQITRRQAINSVIAKTFVAADIPVTKEPNGLLISDNKRAESLTLLPWQEGKPLACNVTVICLLPVSYDSSYGLLPVQLLNLLPRDNGRSREICPTPTSSSLYIDIDWKM